MKKFVKWCSLSFVSLLWRLGAKKVITKNIRVGTEASSVLGLFFQYGFLSGVYPKLRVAERRSVLSEMMGGDAGVDWASHYNAQNFPGGEDDRIGSMAWHEAVPFFNYVSSRLSTSSPMLVIQIGCSSGREISYFASEFGQHSYIGTDIISEVCNFAGKKHDHKNLKFYSSAGHEVWKFAVGSVHDHALIFASGSAQYMYPEDVRELFSKVSEYCPNTTIVCMEPGQILEAHNLSQVRGNFSYSHNYAGYAEAASLTVVEDQIIYPYAKLDDKDPASKTVHYFTVAHT